MWPRYIPDGTRVLRLSNATASPSHVIDFGSATATATATGYEAIRVVSDRSPATSGGHGTGQR